MFHVVLLISIRCTQQFSTFTHACYLSVLSCELLKTFLSDNVNWNRCISHRQVTKIASNGNQDVYKGQGKKQGWQHKCLRDPRHEKSKTTKIVQTIGPKGIRKGNKSASLIQEWGRGCWEGGRGRGFWTSLFLLPILVFVYLQNYI